MESNVDQSVASSSTEPSAESKGSSHNKNKKVNKEKEMRHLNSIFKKTDEKTIWATYKQTGYDIEKVGIF
jgi:hypothetical protein